MKFLVVIAIVCALAIKTTEAGFSFSLPTSASSNPVLQAVNQANAQAQSVALPLINQVRSSVTPRPDQPLQPLVWNASLATNAAAWAQKCFLNDHSDDYYAGKVGETYYVTPIGQAISFATGISAWASQNVTFDLTGNSCFPGVDCSQFRQLAWSRTKQVGCAVNACGSTSNTLLLVCQYFPPGDFDGIVPYVSTTPVSTIISMNISSGVASVVPIGSQLSKRDSTSCSANGQTGKCVAKSSCTAANGATSGYYGSGICAGYLSSNTVCCIYGNSNPTATPTAAPTSAPTQAPTSAPTQAPATQGPTSTPATRGPTSAPTQGPTSAPATKAPTAAPTSAPTTAPAPAGSPLTFPSSQDWRDAAGAVTPIKNQGSCGSCWAFSSTAVAESQVGIFTGGSVVDLSEQQVLSCTNPGNYNCANGGYPGSALQYATNTGLLLDSKLPYTGKDGTCSVSGATDDSFQSSGILSSPGSYTKSGIISALKQYGPMVVTVNADNAWQRYSGGIIGNTTYTSTNHAVTLVGYDSGADAWIIKNSWGSGWGEKGFIRISTTADFAMTYKAPTSSGYSSRIFYLQKTK